MTLTKETAHRKDLNAPMANMEHRHFATIAHIIRGYGMDVSPSEARAIARYFVGRLAHTNPKFDRKRFLLACGVEGA